MTKTEGERSIEKLITDVRLIGKDIKYVQKDILTIKTKLDSNYVTVNQLKLLENRLALIEKIVFGLCSFVLLGFLTACVNFFIK